MITYKIDWLTASLVLIAEMNEPGQAAQVGTIPLRQVLGELVNEKIAPLPFYTHGTEYQFGKVYVNEKRPEQKRLIVMTGDDWTNLSLAGKDPTLTLRMILAYPYVNITRLDFAVDIRDEDFTISDLLTAWDNGTMRTSAETVDRVQRKGKGGKDLGQTVYIGSRSSERLVRCYDKGAQLNIGEKWARIEIELKGRWAIATAKEMASGRTVEAGKGVIRQFVTSGVAWFDNALAKGKGDGYVVPDKRAQTDHEKWLMNIAVPAVLKAIQSDVDWVETAVLGAILAKHRGDTNSE